MEIWHGECDFCEQPYYENRVVRSEKAMICGKCIIEATKLLLEDE